jgi:peroxiredoxin
MVRRFDSASPKLGEPLPDVSGFTADGKPLSLRALKGDYKVLVFGCLT